MSHSTHLGLSGPRSPACVTAVDRPVPSFDPSRGLAKLPLTVGVGQMPLDAIERSDIRRGAPSPHPELPPRLSRPETVGVGNNEDAATEVRSSDGGGRKLEGTASVAELAEVPPHRGQPAPHAARDVLDDDPRRRDLGDDGGEHPPEAGPGTSQAGTETAGGDVLAGEASAEEVGGGPVSRA